MSITITVTSGRDLWLDFNGSFHLLTADAWKIAFFDGATEITASERLESYTSSAGVLDPAASIDRVVSIGYLVIAPSAGSHTYTAKVSVTGGTCRSNTTQRSFSAEERPT